MEESITNHRFALTDEYFKNCCKRASKIIGWEVKPTHRQASKFRSQKGLAYRWGRGKESI